MYSTRIVSRTRTDPRTIEKCLKQQGFVCLQKKNKQKSYQHFNKTYVHDCTRSVRRLQAKVR